MAISPKQSLPRRGRLPAWLAGFAAAVLLGPPASGQDGVFAPDVFAPVTPGATVVVPIYVRDVSGTPLGGDAAAGFKIQDLAITVEYTPQEAVAAIDVERAGVTASLVPLFETEGSVGNRHSWIVAFDEATAPVPLVLNNAAPGDQVAELLITFAWGVVPGTLVEIDVVAPTALGNQPGTLAESLNNGLLISGGGTIQPAGIFADGFESGSTSAWSSAVGGS